jgi:hypothetical protein
MSGLNTEMCYTVLFGYQDIYDILCFTNLHILPGLNESFSTQMTVPTKGQSHDLACPTTVCVCTNAVARVHSLLIRLLTFD